MAKAKNELDLNEVKKKLNAPNAKKFWSKLFFSLPENNKTILQTLASTPNITCHIFHGSVAFRIGKSSIKSIKGYASGFKAGFSKNLNAESIFNTSNFSSFNRTSKDNFVHIAAFYFLYNAFDKVKTESDKTEAAEGEQISLTQSKLKALMKDSGEIRIKVGNKLYNIDKFEQVQSRSKSDAYFSYKGEPKIFLSLKKGSRPGHFQQYGGLVDLGITGENYDKYPDIIQFKSHIDNMFKQFGLNKNKGRYDFADLGSGSYFAYFLSDKVATGKVIFGKDFGDNTFGLNNCHAAVDGDLTFSRVGSQLNTYELGGEYHITLNPYTISNSVGKIISDDVYKPVLMIQRSASRGFNQLGYLNARFNIWPNNKVTTKGRQNLEEIISAIQTKNRNKLFELKTKYVKK